MNKEELKQKIVDANKAYRFGVAIMSDIQFDTLVEEFQAKYPDEYDEFRNSLNEKSDKAKIKHTYVCGSLNKTKYDEPKTVQEFLKKYCNKSISISAKLDGLSGIATYKDHKLVSFATRGDGYEGEDLLNKAPYIKGLLPEISPFFDGEISIRGELILKDDDFEALCKTKTFSNPRNAVAGLMNQKEFDINDMSKVSFVAYTVLGPAYTKEQQFEILNSFGFETAWNIILDYDKNTIVEELFNYANQQFEYETDGLVISSPTYRNEDEYRPKAQVAFKTNTQTFQTRVIDVVFDGPSKNGLHIPVAILEPVEIGGVIVGKATLHNLDFIEEKGLKIGSIVNVVRSGDVIPKILSVVKNDDTCVDIELPTECNCCGSELIRDGVNMRCMNKDCHDQVIHQITHFIKKLGVKNASNATLENLKIFSFDDLIKFVPNKKYKTETKLYSELLDKVFTKSKQDLLAALDIKDVGETLINKIVDFYGFDNVVAGNYNGLPSGIGELTLNKFKENILENLEVVNKFINDSRYNYKEVTPSNSRNVVEHIGSVCFTGALNTMTRSEASKKAEEAGYEVKGGVTKGLTYLVTNNCNPTSAKGKKAISLNIKIISENEFLKLCEKSDCNILTL